MTKPSPTALTPQAYDPMAYNANAFTQLTYKRVEKQRELLYFAKRPESGHSRLEDILASSGMREGPMGAKAALSLGAAFTKAAAEERAPGEAAMAVAFLDTNMPMAAMFNLATGAWTSAQAQTAIASTDRVSAFRALEPISGQEAAAVVVKSAGGLHLAMKKVSALSRIALVSSYADCASTRVVDLEAERVSSTEIFDAAIATAQSRELVVTPFIGLKASQREVCCDAIVVDGNLAFAAFSEKRRVDPTPPYWDRRIATLDESLPAEAQIKAVLQQLLARLGITHAVIHSEHALTDQGPLLSEFTTRPGGGFIPEMVQARYGVDLRAAHVYASFSMTDDLARLAKQAEDKGGGVAIAALYGDNRDRSLGELQQDLSTHEDIVAYSVVTEISNSIVGATDLRAALCVRGSHADAALQRLEEIAGKHGLD